MNLSLTTLSVAAAAVALAAASRTPAPRVPPASEAYTVDGAHSSVIFHTRHLGISEAYGRFDHISDKSAVKVDVDPTKSSILLVVEAESVNTGNEDRDKHLRSGDFFSSKEFPEIVFESKKIAVSGNEWQVTGDLTFHGQTHSVTAKAHPVGAGDTMFGDHRAGFVAELKLDMNDYGVQFVQKNKGAVGPEVSLTVSLECVRK